MTTRPADPPCIQEPVYDVSPLSVGQIRRARWNWACTDGTTTSVSWQGNQEGWKPCVTMNGDNPVVS